MDVYDRFPPIVSVVGGVKRSKEAVQGVPEHEFDNAVIQDGELGWYASGRLITSWPWVRVPDRP